MQWLPIRWEAHRQAALEQARGLGLSPQEVQRAQANVGFRYNRLSAGGGLVPFEIDPTSTPDETAVSDLRGIHFETNGAGQIENISLVGETATEYLGLVTGEDLTVALALAFGSHSFVSPSLSLEHVLHAPLDGRILWLARKEFEPAWLAATDFGRALYYADWLMGRGYDTTLCLEDPFAWPEASVARANGVVFDALVETHTGEHADATRLMLSLEQVGYTPEKVGDQRSIETIWWINKVDFRIHGAGIKYLEDGREDRCVGLNDPHNINAHQGIRLSLRFEWLCFAYPVFARVRALFTLAGLVQKLREAGMVLAPTLENRVTSALSDWTRLTPAKDEVILNH